MGEQKLDLLTALVEKGFLSKEKALDILAKKENNDIPVISAIVDSKYISADNVQSFIEEYYGFTYCMLLDLKSADPTIVDPMYKENKELIFKYHALPIFVKDNVLLIASPNPLEREALEIFKVRYSSSAKFNSADYLLVNEKDFQEFISKLLGDNGSLVDIVKSNKDDGTNVVPDGPDDNGPISTKSNEDDEPVVKFVNLMLAEAVKRGASDLHFEPYEKRYRVRFRLDGVLQEIQSAPISDAPKITARIKVISKLDIAEKRIPQDGRIKISVPLNDGRKTFNKIIDLRVNTLPTLWGEKIVMRILDSSAANLDIDKLGFEDEQKKKYLDALAQPQGMILVTGPTGSGKTVSLYTGLRILNTPEVNISTAEDPVEINLEGINQVQINNKAGLTFASALRSFLRQDPDVVMVGEIRDLETAEIAIKAAQTGHLVLSTLHTNSAPETLTRLLNMGVPSYNIASSVSLIIAQRLGRRLCEKCKIPEHYTEQQLLNIGYTQEDIQAGIKIYSANPEGCEYCNKGYKGRVGIYEIFKMTNTLAQIIMEGGNSLQIAEQAEKEGMVPLRKSGLKKVAQGVTSLKEILSVTQG